MLTRAGLGVLSAGLTLALGGLALGNPLLLLASALPLFLLLAATPRRTAAPDVTRAMDLSACRVGEEVTVELAVTLPAGAHAVEVHQALPAELQITRGSNVHLVTGHPTRARRASVRFTVRAHRRGTFTLPPVRWEVVSLLGLTAPVKGEAAGDAWLRVAPRLGGLARVRGVHIPREGAGHGTAVNRIGLAGTDFADLREYATGDPPKSINWKATARRMAAGASSSPLVNEYEREGQRTVFVIVDASAHLDVGTSVETALDRVLDAAGGLARFLLHRGHRVGAANVDARGTHVIAPDTGPAHAQRVRRVLEDASPRPGGDLMDAVARAAPYLHGGRPLIILFTRVTAPADAIVDAVRRLRVATGAGPAQRAPVVVVDVRPLALTPAADAHAEEARALLDALDAPVRDAVRHTGATVVPWDPARGSFARAILKGVAR